MPDAPAPLYPGAASGRPCRQPGVRCVGLLRQRFADATAMMGLLPVAPDNAVTMFWSLPAADLAGSAARPRGRAARGAARCGRAARSSSARSSSQPTSRARPTGTWPCRAGTTGPVLFMGDAAHGTSPQLGPRRQSRPARRPCARPQPRRGRRSSPRRWTSCKPARPARPLLPNRQQPADAVLPVDSDRARHPARPRPSPGLPDADRPADDDRPCWRACVAAGCRPSSSTPTAGIRSSFVATGRPSGPA